MDYTKRISSDNITRVAPNEVFVFGSNEGGKHGKGAAKTALGWGAKWGQASGLQGKTYGIPTKDSSVRKVLSVDQITKYVDEFVEFAKSRQDLTFLVSEVGCGLAGYSPKDIAPLFHGAVKLDNVHLPRRFWRVIVNRFENV